MKIEEAIKICEKIIKNNNEIIKQARANKDINAMQLTADCDKESSAIENLIQAYKEQEEKIQSQQSELEKKDKIIDEMSNFIDTRLDNCLLNYLNIDEPCEHYNKDDKILCKDCIKQYFERRAEE